jgi:predicted nucleotidyltransferase
MSATTTTAIREDVLRDPRYPVHKIADRLLPYLRVLVEQFQPQQVILFGSYAYGQPDEHSDVDLLVVMPIAQSPARQCANILRAWRPLRRSLYPPLPIEVLVESPERHQAR